MNNNTVIEFNITEQELKDALEFAQTDGDSRFNTITMIVDKSNGIGTGLSVRNAVSKPFSITDVSSW